MGYRLLLGGGVGALPWNHKRGSGGELNFQMFQLLPLYTSCFPFPWSIDKANFEILYSFKPLPHMPILGSSTSAANRNMDKWDTVI